jgi:hypothetical protein
MLPQKGMATLLPHLEHLVASRAKPNELTKLLNKETSLAPLPSLIEGRHPAVDLQTSTS